MSLMKTAENMLFALACPEGALMRVRTEDLSHPYRHLRHLTFTKVSNTPGNTAVIVRCHSHPPFQHVMRTKLTDDSDLIARHYYRRDQLAGVEYTLAADMLAVLDNAK